MMKKPNLGLFVLLMIPFSFTFYCCTIGQTETDKSLSLIVTKSDNLSKILRKTNEMPYLKSLIVLNTLYIVQVGKRFCWEYESLNIEYTCR